MRICDVHCAECHAKNVVDVDHNESIACRLCGRKLEVSIGSVAVDTLNAHPKRTLAGRLEAFNMLTTMHDEDGDRIDGAGMFTPAQALEMLSRGGSS